MASRLEGKVCVITGAASGTGAVSAEIFASEGPQVAGVDIDPGAAGTLPLEVDVTDEDQVAEMYEGARGAGPNRRDLQQRRDHADGRRLRRLWRSDLPQRGVLVLVGHEDERADHHRDTEHVPTDGGVVHQAPGC